MSDSDALLIPSQPQTSNPTNPQGEQSSGETEQLLPKQEVNTYGYLAGFATVINYIIGTGVFGLPFAYFTAGIPLSAIAIMIFFFINVITMNYILDTTARSEGKTEVKENKGENVFKILPHNEIKYRLFDYSTLSGLWGGNIFKWASFTCLTLYTYGGLWAYAATATTTISTLFWMFYGEPEHCLTRNGIWECQLSYYMSLLLYAAIVVSLSFIDLSKQGWLQMILTFYRFFAFGVMLVTCVVELAVHGPLAEDVSFLYSFKWVGFGTMFTHTVFALTCHQNLPDAITPVKKKGFLFWTTGSAMLVSTIFYFLIGLICSWTFGEYVVTPITNKWSTYTGNEGGWGEGNIQWYAYPIQYLILLFPVINLCNTYPLVATTLSSNLKTCFTYKFKSNHRRWTNFISTVLAYVPPILFTTAVGSLQIIFDVSGLFAIFLCFTIPSLLQILSIYKNRKEFGPESTTTPYTFKCIGNYWVAGFLFILSFVFFVMCTVFLVLEKIQDDESATSSSI